MDTSLSTTDKPFSGPLDAFAWNYATVQETPDGETDSASAEPGTLVYAVENGSIAMVQTPDGLNGVQLLSADGNRLWTFMGVGALRVNNGDSVTPGQAIGRVGSDGEIVFELETENAGTTQNVSPYRFLLQQADFQKLSFVNEDEFKAEAARQMAANPNTGMSVYKGQDNDGSDPSLHTLSTGKIIAIVGGTLAAGLLAGVAYAKAGGARRRFR